MDVYDIEGRIEKLIASYRELEVRHEKLIIKHQKIQEDHQVINSELMKEKEKNNIYKLSQAFLSESNNDEAKKQIELLVREIDKCIALLDEK